MDYLMTQLSNIPPKKCSFLYFLLLGLIVILYTFPACSLSPNETPRFYTFKIINTFPHDENAFTQGFLISDGFFYESTGRYGASSLRRVDPLSGKVIKIHELSDRFFGEGLTLVGDELIQLTWRSRVGFAYDKETFALQQEFDYQTQGWGITYDGKQLIMSDGTATLYFLDPETFKKINQIEVFDEDGSPVSRLNELEFIKGDIYANIWGSDHIVRINSQTGSVVAWIDLTGLLPPEDSTGPVDVLNGIAYDVKNDRIFVTGKLWPKVFEIELIPIEDS